MQNNSIHKTIHRNVGSNEVNRLYKFSTEEDMTSFVETLNRFFSRSTTILDKGKFNQNKRQFIDSIATETWEELNLEGNFFIFTRENLSYKTEEQTKMEKVIKKNPLYLTEKPTTRKYKVDWTDEEIKQLYSGTIKEVAKKLNKSYSKVYEKRKFYESENPGFVIPEVALYKREKKAKPEVTKVEKVSLKLKEVKPEVKFKETIQDLTLKEVEILWNNTSTELRQKYPDVFKSIFVIQAMRTEYCKLNPQFVIPLAANFNSAHLPNMTEAKIRKQANKKEVVPLTSELTADEMSILWDANGKEVGKLLNKNYQAIYAARCNYCRNNPDFVIPHIASFNPPSDVSNKVEEKPVVIKEAKQPKVEVAEVEVAKPEIQPEIVAESVKAVQPQLEQPNNWVMTEMAEMLKVMMANGMKPSKVTLDNGKIVCDF